MLKTLVRIFASNQSSFSETQQRLLSTSIKFKATECDLIYELMFNSKRQLGDDKSEVIQKDEFLKQLAELEKLAKNTQDRVVEIRLDGFREAGKVLGLLN